MGILAAVTFGCAEPVPPAGVVGHVRAYFGGIAADEPEAVLIARDVLSAGGSAVDAVVSMALTMMVTRPDAAGPGGGGMCVVFDARTAKGEAIEFLPHTPKSRPPAGRWLAASPGSFRGLFALHARYGRLRWEQLVLPAERFARFGVKIPRVLTKTLATSGRLAIKGSRGRAVYFDIAGAPLREGDILRQVDLASTLSRIKIAPGDFYTGPLARRFVEGVRGAGGWLTIEDLRSYRPRWVKALPGKFGPHDVYFLPSPATGGEVAAGIWANFGDKGFFSGIFKKGGKARAMTEFAAAARQSFRGVLAKPQLQSVTASAGALAVDRDGNSAACVLTMDRPFGSGRIAGDTGIIAVQPARAGALLALSAMIVANRNTRQTFLAATGAGDKFVSSAMTESVLRVLKEKMEVGPALRAPRTKIQQGNKAASIGQVNIMSCDEGSVTAPKGCVVRTDPRGFGHAVNAEF